MKNYKPIYTLGLLVFALYGLTSFNPLSVAKHLAQLSEGSLDLASKQAPEPHPATETGVVAAIVGEASSAATQGPLGAYIIQSDGSYKAHNKDKALSYTTADGNKLIITEIKKVQSGTDTHTQFVYEIIASSELATEAGICSECRDFLTKTEHSAILSTDFSKVTGDLRTHNDAIRRSLEDSFKIVLSHFDGYKNYTESDACSDLDYREGRKCFADLFKLAEQCSSKSSRTTRTSRSSRTQTAKVDCTDAPDLKDVIAEYKAWASDIATDPDLNLSADRISRLKDVTKDRDVAKHIDGLVKLKKDFDSWDDYNLVFERDMMAIYNQISELDRLLASAPNEQARNALLIQRKQLVLDAEAGAMKYQRSYKAAFNRELFKTYPGAEDMVAQISNTYNETLTPFSEVFRTQDLLTLSPTSAVPKLPEDPTKGDTKASTSTTTSLDLSHLTNTRQSRGYVSTFNYENLKNSFTYSGMLDDSGRRNYNSNDPYLTQYQPSTTFPQGRTMQTRNWSTWMPNSNQQWTSQVWSQPQQAPYQTQSQPFYQQSSPWQTPPFAPPRY